MNTKRVYAMHMLPVLVFAALTGAGVEDLEIAEDKAIVENKAPLPVPVQWQGLKVALLGDSITDSRQKHRIYWQYLSSWLGWQAKVYGRAGNTWGNIAAQAAGMEKEMGNDVDAIFIFAGTNDYCGSRPLGNWYDEKEGVVNWWGNSCHLKQRIINLDRKTFRGSINFALERLKKRYPDSQIVLMTPTKRAFCQFGPTNVQPAEDWPNTLGLHLEDYVRCVREAGQIWSCPVIDLYGESGFLPCTEGYGKYVRDEKRDGLHPNGLGHERLARLIYHRLFALPGTYRGCTGK